MGEFDAERFHKDVAFFLGLAAPDDPYTEAARALKKAYDAFLEVGFDDIKAGYLTNTLFKTQMEAAFNAR
ncbi:hypothetical protein ACFWY5_29640 [Nonomuraea sp. NPDC059007]|uniref:hypothetical protein n=1 Tax=Nonomuraea sp. NPDC059007 TaxID=3346692 RepID=UPI0036CF49B4